MIKKTIITAGLALVFLCAFSQENRSDAAWKELATVKINKEEPRAFFVSHFTKEGASKILSVDDCEKIYEIDSAQIINGKWKFLFANTEGEVPSDFFKKNFDDSKWALIDVPCSWQARGFDSKFYSNIHGQIFFNEKGQWLDTYAMKGKEPSEWARKPYILDQFKQRGIYRRSFKISDKWNGKEIYLRLNGVRTSYNLYVNGKFVGYSEDAFTSAEFNISKFLGKGENSIALEVFKFSTSTAIDLQDMPQFNGILRDVVLLARPSVQIRDYYAAAQYSADLKQAELDLNLDLRNLSGKAQSVSVEAFLLDFADGKKTPLFTEQVAKLDKRASIKKSGIKLNSFKLWSPDKANLYNLVFELKDAQGKTLEAISADWGFRNFTWQNPDRQFFLNNVPYKIKGVNIHDWSPDNGKSVSFAWTKKDMELMKNANINSIRTAHYPRDDVFYMLCNRYGFAVMDENNFESHGMWNQIPTDLDEWVPVGVDRMKNMLIRDRNVPSVIIFSSNNESGTSYNKTLQAMEKISRELDPSRPVHDETGLDDPNNSSDFYSPMYGGIDRINGYLRNKNRTKPFFFCEYTHAMGNGMGNFKDTWDLIRAHKDVNGGYIWDWVDQGLYMPREDKPEEMFISDGRDWKTLPSAGNFCSNGVVFADRSYGVKYLETQIVYQDLQIRAFDAETGKLTLLNEFLNTNANEFDAKITVECEGEKIAESPLPAFNLEAGNSKEFEIKIPKFDASKNANYHATIEFTRKNNTLFAKKGDVVSKTQVELKVNFKPTELPLGTGSVAIKTQDDKGNISGKAGKVDFVFTNGNLSSYKVNGQEMLVSPFAFEISSAPTDNFRQSESSILKSMGIYDMPQKSESFAKEKIGNCFKTSVKRSFINKDGDGYAYEIAYLILPSGFIHITSYMQKINDLDYDLRLPLVAIKTQINKELQTVDFIGKGPYMNYNDRNQAEFFGRYKIKVSDFVENYSYPQDQGNRENVRFAAFVNEKKNLGLIFFAPQKPLPMAWLPNTQEELKLAKHPHNLPATSGTEVRIAHSVLGIGNASCGPRTLNKYSNFFKGEIMWQFQMGYVNADPKQIENIGAMALPEKIYKPRETLAENLKDDSVKTMPSGEWISQNAKVEYSSRDEKWAPKSDTLTGEMRGEISFHTKEERHPWLVIDLAKEQEIQGFQILNRPDKGLYNRATPMNVFVSGDNKSWKKIHTITAIKGEWIFSLDAPAKARYVKIQAMNNGPFHLKGVKIFGKNKK